MASATVASVLGSSFKQSKRTATSSAKNIKRRAENSRLCSCSSGKTNFDIHNCGKGLNEINLVDSTRISAGMKTASRLAGDVSPGSRLAGGSSPGSSLPGGSSPGGSLNCCLMQACMSVSASGKSKRFRTTFKAFRCSRMGCAVVALAYLV
jgi:hypothetical protein